MNKVLTTLLIASVGVNVFLGGFVAGRTIGRPDGEYRLMSIHKHLSGPMGFDVRILSDEQREAFHRVFEQRREDLKAERQNLISSRRAFGEALAADPWDRGRAEAALSALHEVESAQQSKYGALLIDAFEGLPAKQRKELVRSQLERHGMHGGHIRRHRRPQGVSLKDGASGETPLPETPSSEQP
jgi:Spy/CpxP family protein refolding chaperone